MKHANVFVATLGGIISMITVNVYAQQEAQFTQFLENGLSYNPAYAGTGEMLDMTVIHREQWFGWDGRPRASMIGLHTPMSYESLGLGLTINNTQMGPLRDTYIAADVSYALNLDDVSKFYFGLKLGLDMFAFDRGLLKTSSGQNLSIFEQRDNNVKPNVGFGVLWEGEKFNVGLSTPRLLKGSYDKLDSKNLQQQHFYASLSYFIELGVDWKIRPSTLFKYTSGSPLAWDIAATAIYDDKLWVGAFYRLKAAFGLLVQVEAAENFRIGIASDFGSTQMNKGTIEVMLSYKYELFKKMYNFNTKKFKGNYNFRV